MKRVIVQIDEEKCNGCGECIPNCVEGALQIIDGKAKLVKDKYCDGLGACLGTCPQDAITIIEREAAPFDEEAVHEYLEQMKQTPTPEPKKTQPSGPTQWPVQLNLVPLKAGFFDGKELLVVADCVAVALPSLHDYLKGRSVVMGCPKFDDVQHYVDKLGEILRRNQVMGVQTVHMEVPCCSGLNYIVEKAMEASGKPLQVTRRIVNVTGEICELHTAPR